MSFTPSERIGLGLLLVIFACFTWYGVTMFYSGDDMMNMYLAWMLNPWRLAEAQVLFWMPVYRPLGAGIYRVFYALVGFHPAPLYVFCWLLLAANVVLAFRFFRVLAQTSGEALTALSLVLVHGNYQDLYQSAGTIYDRLCFTFTVLAVATYPKLRARGGWRWFAAISALCVLCMHSKESGVALPVLLLLYEVIYVLPAAWKSGNVRSWLRTIAPLYILLAVISLVFVARVNRTPELVMTAAYHPRLSPVVWFERVAEYFRILSYGHVPFTALTCACTVALMLTAAILLQNRAMLFGLGMFIVTITPVALISSRPGYVLYVPALGLGLYLAASLFAAARVLPWPRPQAAEFALFLLVTAAVTWFHQRNWPALPDPRFSPELRLTEQFRRDFPTLPKGAKLLFLSDDFPKDGWDLVFNLRLLYRDPTLLVHRLMAAADQRADPAHPVSYDHVFAAESGHVAELDGTDIQKSIRLHILRDYSVGRELDMGHRDAGAYVVSGVMDGDPTNPTRWTTPEARLKFDLYPASASFTAKFWVPDFVARTAARTLTVLVNGHPVGSLPLTKDGMNEISLPVAASDITRDGFTTVDMNVTNPYKDPGGTAFGVVLLRAGFEYN